MAKKEKIVMDIHDKPNVREHNHDFLEVSYVLEGCANHTLEGKTTVISKGDYFIVDYNRESNYDCSTLKGLVGEKYFEFLCAKNQIPCFRANSDVDGYDYLIKLKDSFKKVQVKTKEFLDRTDRIGIF